MERVEFEFEFEREEFERRGNSELADVDMQSIEMSSPIGLFTQRQPINGQSEAVTTFEFADPVVS